MNKLNIYIRTCFYSSLIGAVVEVVVALVRQQKSILLSDLFRSMATGMAIGLVSLLFQLYIFMKFKKSPVIGFVSNFLVVAGIIAIEEIFYQVQYSRLHIRSNWIVSIIVAETLSFVLIAVWYKQAKIFNQQLEKKKSAITDDVPIS
ncbi:MAG: hypothetical protein N2484_02535 [Clostridia bacterium]|nr:hypothetical protein [Clostridia bacterium]